MEANEKDKEVDIPKITSIDVETIQGGQNDKSQWEKLRFQYIGSSQIGVILNTSNFITRKQLLLTRLGHLEKQRNNQMYLGLLYEKDIADKLRYYDNDIESCYTNYINNNPIRHIRKEENVYILHFNREDDSKISIIVSPDYLMTESLTSNEYYPVDIKFVTFLSNASLTGNVSDYVWQSIMQQLCYQVNHGYLFYQIGNTDIKLTTIEMDNYSPFLDVVINEVYKFYQEIEYYRNKTLSEILSSYRPEEYYDGELTTPIERKEIIEGNMEDNAYVEKYVELRHHKSMIDSAMKEIKTYIINRYPEAREIIFDRYRVSISNTNYFNVKDRNYDGRVDE